jgi:tetratricopeptide (TPR) repeat protein
LYHDRLANVLYFRFGAYQTCIELLRGLFPDGEERPPRLKKEGDQAWTLNGLANSYSLSGQSRRAVPLFEAQNAIQERAEDKTYLATGLGNLARQQTILGDLRAAEGNLRRCVALCKETGSRFDEAVGHQELGHLLAYEGAFDEAAKEMDAALAPFTERGEIPSQCVVWGYGALRGLLMGDMNTALRAARRARELADEAAKAEFPQERAFIVAEWLRGWALVESGRGERLAEAETHLTEALTRCRWINLVETEPDILLAWARWHRVKGNAQQARADAEEALDIADRCEYRLVQADAHNFLAQMALDEGERKAAREHAETAKERAWCDGPPHCYKPALEEAERLLGEAGAGA